MMIRLLYCSLGLTALLALVVSFQVYAQESSNSEQAISSASKTFTEVTSLGPIKLGMSREDVEKLGVTTPLPGYPEFTVPFQVKYENNRVKKIRVYLKYLDSSLTVGNIEIPSHPDPRDVLKRIGDCGEPDVREGGTMYICHDDQVQVGLGGPLMEVDISIGEK